MRTAWAATGAEDQGSPDLVVVLIESLLDWPFLALIVLLVLVFKYRNEVQAILRSRQIMVEIGGNKLSIGQAVEAIDQDTEESLVKLQERLSELEDWGGKLSEAVQQMQTSAPSAEVEPVEPPAGASPQEKTDRVWQSVQRELLDSKFVWRSLDRLSLAAAATPDQVHEVLAAHPDEVKIGRDKSDRTIARHQSRVPGY